MERLEVKARAVGTIPLAEVPELPHGSGPEVGVWHMSWAR
jgi:hypothetical protein